MATVTLTGAECSEIASALRYRADMIGYRLTDGTFATLPTNTEVEARVMRDRLLTLAAKVERQA